MEEPKFLARYDLGEHRDMLLVVTKTVFTLHSKSQPWREMVFAYYTWEDFVEDAFG